MEKTRLSISINFPVFILFSIILLTTNFYIFITSALLIAIHLNFISFLWTGIIESGKMIFFIFMYLILSSGAFSILPIEIQLNHAKIGLFVGFLISILFCNYIIKRSNLSQKKFGFANTQNSYEVIELSLIFLFITILVVFIYSILIVFWSEDFVNIKDILLLVFIFIALYLHGNFYKVWDNFFTYDKSNHKIGLLIILAAVVVLFWIDSEGMYAFIALFFFLIGMFLIQYSSFDSKSKLRNDFTNYFIIPSSFASLFIFILYIFLNNNSESNFTAWLMPVNEAKLQNELNKIENDLKNSIKTDFDKLKKQGKLDPNAEPIVDFKIKESKSIFLRNEINLEGFFSYNYENPLSISIQNYSEGEYNLENSSISKIIVRAFDISIQKYLSKYLEEGRNVTITILGTSDAIPFSENKKTKYLGEFGVSLSEEVINETVGKNEDINIYNGTELNHSILAYLRCYGVKNYISLRIPILKLSDTKYISKIYYDQNNFGVKYRRAEIKIEIFDIFKKMKK